MKDSFGRHVSYLRLSVTDRCDLRCSYCIPKGFHDFETPDHWLSFNEIERVVGAFARLGVQRLRLTGGEPLVRKGLTDLAARLAAVPGIDDLSLSTNGIQLARHAEALHQAGVARLNVSLDSLDPERYRQITGGGRLDKVLDGLAAAKAIGFAPVKINMVVMKGINDHEAAAMVDFCLEHDFTLRFIETMPMGSTGQHEATDHFLDLSVIQQRLAQRFELVPAMMHGGGPARYVQVVGSTLKIGFITPISQHFCDTCNRIRLSVDGTLYLCLGQDHTVALRPHLRQGISDDGLRNLIMEAIARKPLKHEFNEKPSHILRFMSKVGG